MKIAVYTICLNEEKHVTRWATSCQEADYRIVADTGSTDTSVCLLQQEGVTVHDVCIDPWRFDTAKNVALSLVPADADVCISLDMDAWLPADWRQHLESVWQPHHTRMRHSYHYVNAQDEFVRNYPHAKVHSRRGYHWQRCASRSSASIWF